VLCDFETSKHENAPSMSMTVQIHTPRYAAPEIANGKPFSYESDIYSLGLVICEILCGSAPFCGSAPKDAAAATRHLPEAIKDQKQIDLLKEVCLQCSYTCAFHATTLSPYFMHFFSLDAQL
jgi:serine/threonine protein kinase